MFLPIAFFCMIATAITPQTCMFAPLPTVQTQQHCLQIAAKQRLMLDEQRDKLSVYAVACVPVKSSSEVSDI